MFNGRLTISLGWHIGVQEPWKQFVGGARGGGLRLFINYFLYSQYHIMIYPSQEVRAKVFLMTHGLHSAWW
jgi:hypothetical protein